ncbi:protein phosphatase inhibitor 2-like [Centruroides vittatus]|uniref:protein phosphatase inhibitor 2-like n=1 Tax=Centruroides vittatus TaxID=120091 RepID=UPI00350EC104
MVFEVTIMAEKKPRKSILKTSSSFDQTEASKNAINKPIKWDEMNILQTLHPLDKDYGYMKVDEPKTPFSYYDDSVDLSDQEAETLDPELLARKINLSKESPRKCSDDKNNEVEESLGDRVKSKVFEYKRKLHYNEYYAVKLARKLMAEEDDDDDDDSDSDEDEINNSDKNQINNQYSI